MRHKVLISCQNEMSIYTWNNEKKLSSRVSSQWLYSNSCIQEHNPYIKLPIAWINSKPFIHSIIILYINSWYDVYNIYMIHYTWNIHDVSMVYFVKFSRKGVPKNRVRCLSTQNFRRFLIFYSKKEFHILWDNVFLYSIIQGWWFLTL